MLFSAGRLAAGFAAAVLSAHMANAVDIKMFGASPTRPAPAEQELDAPFQQGQRERNPGNHHQHELGNAVRQLLPGDEGQIEQVPTEWDQKEHNYYGKRDPGHVSHGYSIFIAGYTNKRE